MGSGAEGVWIPCGLNECIKIGRYQTGCHFSPHIDGPWIPDESCASILTLVLYLNDSESENFPLKGGATNFLLPSNSSTDASSSSLIGKSQTHHEVIASISPKVGRALLFRHDLLHEGAPLLEGRKFILRTEVLFRRIKSALKVPRLPPSSAKKQESAERVISLYNQSDAEYEQGKASDFVESYLEALEIQKEETANETRFILPPSIMLEILRTLDDARDVVRMMLTSKGLYRLGRTGELWMNLYLSRWQTIEDREGTPVAEIPLTVDWFKIFKKKFITGQPESKGTKKSRRGRKEKREWLLKEDDSYLLAGRRLANRLTLGDVGGDSARPAIVVDCGGHTFKVGMAGQERPFAFIPPVVGHQRHVHSFSPFSRIVAEEALKRAGLYSLHYPCDNDDITHWDNAELIMQYSFSNALKVTTEDHPIIVTENSLYQVLFPF